MHMYSERQKAWLSTATVVASLAVALWSMALYNACIKFQILQ